MRILIFEDDHDRIDWFKEKFEGHELFITEHVDEATSWLINFRFDLIFLDHDIHGDMGFKNSGSHLVINMTRNETIIDVNDNVPIYIHSLNLNGACRMEGILMFHGFWSVSRIPFTYLKTLFRVTENN